MKYDTDSRTQSCLISAGRPDSFLLETDYPYLDKHEKPWMEHENGVKAADIMGIPTMKLVKVCNKNAARMYCLVKTLQLMDQFRITFTSRRIPNSYSATR